MRISYVLPLRSSAPQLDAEFTGYLRRIAERAELLVVDGSPPEVFAAHRAAWGSFARHLPVDPELATPNGKVGGVLTGVRHASHERVVIADDDVRYDPASLAAVAAALDHAEVVRPQNYFAPLPWHALWDTGRILLNRATDGDWPGTLAVRRSALLATGGYDGGVLFENLELVRTVVAAGGRERLAREVLVLRRPCDASHFYGQRVRQAYDEFARPGRLAVQLAVVPAVAALAASGRWGTLVAAAAAAAVAALAEAGRRRDGGTRVFPAGASLLAPGWLLERGVCAWLAVGRRLLRGGVRYRDSTLRRAATPVRELRRRHAGALSSTSTSIGLNEPLLDSSAEHAVTPTTMSISARSSR
ncbi:MAG: glycosyltransferase family 2 protein [Gemmatimonadetes bacterium]|nr:glycosyltransferase family 2 protein [Gemmatimonadota bacterium]